jgi:hypothetical protein
MGYVTYTVRRSTVRLTPGTKDQNMPQTTHEIAHQSNGLVPFALGLDACAISSVAWSHRA